MARSPTIWYVVYGIAIPLIVMGVGLYTGWGGILVFIGTVLWMAFALAMLSPRSD